jgi:hypothetical protein
MTPLMAGKQLRVLATQQQLVATRAAMKAMVAEYGESEAGTPPLQAFWALGALRENRPFSVKSVTSA